MSKHTQGPWRYQENSDVYTHIVRGPNDEYVCGFSQDSNGRAEADARLTATAPELLFRLNRLCREVGPLTTHYEHAIRQAIGNTNYAVLKLALKEADEAAQKAEGGK